ncbi:hypothetical protein F0562_017078 [Nyssa sinensis]|uniref:t-SNARE coiled-coil homology domain-containing protein n=1 Tax=Nyssa sinensis TaxID=561372 RepID=A0A5J4ZGT5_9ASTE|nr:hypothetical protein F0562_017078 [Nyssa sinensis]
MNDLFSGSFSREDHHSPGNVQMTNSPSGGVNLDRFFEDVEAVKDELRDLETLCNNLQTAHEQSKTLHNAKSIKDLRSRMDNDVASSVNKAKVIKVRLEALDRSNASNRSLPGCGPGSSSDRTRTSIVNGLRKKLQDSMNSFNSLRQKIATEYRETVQRRYYTVTGENADEAVIDRLISTGESETFLQKAIQEQGRGRVLDTIMEIQERHDAVKEIERNLKELHQVFLDMAVLVESQGEQIDDIESQAYNKYSDDLEMLCAILCVGLYPNVVQRKRRGKRTTLYTKEVGKFDIHPASVNAGVHLFPLPYLIYSEKVKTSGIYIRDATNTSDYALIMFGGNLIPSKTGEGIEMLGGYLHFSASKNVLELIRAMSLKSLSH